jgi:hypothetical protein
VYFLYANPFTGNVHVAFQQFCSTGDSARTNSGLDILRWDPLLQKHLQGLRKHILKLNAKCQTVVIDGLISKLKKIEEEKLKIQALYNDCLLFL